MIITTNYQLLIKKNIPRNQNLYPVKGYNLISDFGFERD